MRNDKTPLGSNSRRSHSYHHFGWAFPISTKLQVDEGRPIAFKTRFFDFPHRGETKKHPRDRIQRGRFHTTILGGLFRAAQKSRVYEGSPTALKRRFFDFPHRGRNEKTPLGSKSRRSDSYHHFWWAFPISTKLRVDEGPPIALKTRFFDFPHQGETKKDPWDRIQQSRFHTIILGGLFKAAQKSLLTKVVQLRSKSLLSTFPIG